MVFAKPFPQATRFDSFINQFLRKSVKNWWPVHRVIGNERGNGGTAGLLVVVVARAIVVVVASTVVVVVVVVVGVPTVGGGGGGAIVVVVVLGTVVVVVGATVVVVVGAYVVVVVVGHGPPQPAGITLGSRVATNPSVMAARPVAIAQPIRCGFMHQPRF